ncbi:MAG: PKD domain-containing protein [Saprospiraceae bacterium]|nr:PKD domain-containing protein [Saprospiraceae bacterium]
MKKNISFVVGLFSLLLLGFIVFRINDGRNKELLKSNSIKSEIINTLPPQPLSTEGAILPSDCKDSKGVCCKNKKNTPHSTPSLDNPAEKDTENERLERLEDPDDVVSADPHARKATLQQRFAEAAEIEFEKTKDPNLGYVPTERRLEALEKTRRMQEQMMQDKSLLRGALANVRWLERGPNNVGGRTTAIQVDLNDKTGNTVFAAGVTGGLYKVTDVTGTAKWEKVNDWLENQTISSIAQDPTNPKIMYVGTGDVDGSGAFVPGQGGTVGVGIYKSIDGGKTWNLLPATTVPRSASYQYVSEIIVTPDSGHIFASTFTGVFKSKDGGQTWRIVLGGKIWDISRGSDGRIYAAQDGGIAHVSKSQGEAGTFVALNSNTGYPTGLRRLQIACAPSNPEVVYIVGSNASNQGSPIYRSANGGTTWSQGTTPPRGCGGGGEFTSGQAWYDLTIAVDPLNETMVWVGGIEQWRSTDGGANWLQMTGGYCPNSFPYSHVDQHAQHFDPLNPSVLYLGNDGGVFRVTNAAGRQSIKELNNGYTTTQFYACAIHPDSGSTHFLAGAQDNNSILVSGSKNIGNGRAVLGGDGFYCFIDQDNPNYQIVSSQFGNWGLSTNGGVSFGGGANSNGAFYCPADYDSKGNTLYAQTNGGDLFRWKVTGSASSIIDVSGVTLSNISQIYADQSVDNRIYVGTRTGNLYRIDSAHLASPLTNVSLVGRLTGYISSIEVERGNPNHILVCISNYGVTNIHETTDGGTNWTVCDGNLPDMPIRWGLFNPNDPKQAMIATDAGVWTTELLNGSSTVWLPPVPGRGTPLVRTDMLKIRSSDNMVLAGTYGRGLWTTNVFGKAKAEIEFPQVAYLDVPVTFKGESSVAAGSFLWQFSDGTTDTLENTKKTYKQIGTYNVNLTINNDNSLKASGQIKILPNLPTPYKTTTASYGGNFDGGSWDAHFGAWSAAGSKFVRGKSTVFGKDGTHSGQFCYVLDPTAQNYQKGTIAYLHTPNFDMSQTGIYQFSFWANFDAQRGRDGLQVEYSLDRGITWRTLGSNADADWYNYYNNSVTDGAFNIGESMITGTADDWTRFKLNISNLSGNANVAFRFVFKSANFAPSAGVAIDDVIITRYEGKNETAIITQSGNFASGGTSIDIKFQTQPEYYAQSFDVEMSSNGRDWKKVENTVKATGGSTEELQQYSVNVTGTPLDLYYFRIRSVNGNTVVNYNFEFRTTPFVVKRNKDLPLAINKIFPSPFTNYIGVTFTDSPNADVVFDLFDVAGRLIASNTVVQMTGVYQELSVPNLPKAVYLLRVKIGDNKPESIKLFGGN